MENNFEKSEVQHFISYLEGIINRMASNSANCKNWLLAIIAGCLGVQPSVQAVVDKIWLAYPIVGLFCLLDSYYLGCEKYFCDVMGDFVKKVRMNDGEYVASLYKFEKRTVGDDVESVIRRFFSIATWPFYGTIIALAVLVDRGAIGL